MTNKEKIYDFVKEYAQTYNEIDDTKCSVTTEYVCETMGMDRSLVSRLLNELNKERRIIKINTRPVLFIDRRYLETKYCIEFKGNMAFESFKQIKKSILKDEKGVCSSDDSDIGRDKNDSFCELIGYDGSLKSQIEQCRMAVQYPPSGLPVLITGPTGTGKSYMAKAIVEYAVMKNIIKKDAPYVIFNCAEYADNPELLSSSIFGYAKGAFTGASSDYKGVIEEADGGYLFLDEIHRLSHEGQEKLFLFMDSGMFRRIGESKGWRKASVRFIFATTEKTDKYLLNTFIRRIPVIIGIPSLGERPPAERLKLIYHYFRKEALCIKHDLVISKKVLKTLLVYDFQGNVGQLINEIKFACARAYDSYCRRGTSGGCLDINLMMLQEHMFKNIKKTSLSDSSLLEDIISDSFTIKWEEEEETVINIRSIEKHEIFYETFYSELLSAFKNMKNSESKYKALEGVAVIIERYFDKILYSKKQQKSQDVIYTRFELILNACKTAFSFSGDKYGLIINNNICYKISYYIGSSLDFKYITHMNEYDRKFKKNNELMKECFESEYRVISSIIDRVEENIDISIGTAERTIITAYLIAANKQKIKKRTKAIIIAHGLSTASSIANVTNHMLGDTIFEPFDMPVDMNTKKIVKNITEYLKDVDVSRGVIMLVDMGSLEEIYGNLKDINNCTIVIANNVTTLFALNVGSGIIRGIEAEEIMKESCNRIKPEYKVFKTGKKAPAAIITTCITGIGTASKIKELLDRSINCDEDIVEIIAYDFMKLKNRQAEVLFEEYTVIAVIGTQDPLEDRAPFFSIEDLITGKRENEFSKLIRDFLPMENIEQISRFMVKNFTLENVLDHLTILNPVRILDQIENAINMLQQELNEKFNNEVKICLYIHLCCLIERLVTKNQIDNCDSSELENFKECYSDFVTKCRRSFSVIENLYSVTIPETEIYYIFEILRIKMPEAIKKSM